MEQGRRRWQWDTWVIVAGLVLAVIGAVLVVTSLQQRIGSFGWFAYAPLSSSTFVPDPGVPARGELFGYALAGVGMLILAWCVGNRLGPLRGRPYLPDFPRSVRMALAVSAGVAVLLVLAGASVLLGAPPSLPLREAGAPSGTSVASSSELVFAFDPLPRPLLLPGAALLLGGLLASATALGRRAGRLDPDPGTANGSDREVLP